MGNLVPQNAGAFLRFAQGVVSYTRERMGLTPKILKSGTKAKIADLDDTGESDNEEFWAHIPTAAFNDLSSKVTEFEQVFNTTPVDSNRSQTERRNNAQRQCESFLRYFIRFYLRHPEVKNEELLAMNIPPIDTIRTSHTEVTAQVDLTFRPSYANQVVLAFKMVGAANRARPANTIGLFVAWAFGEDEPTSLDDYTHNVLATRSPFHIEFDTHDSGKRVWFRAAWQNARGVRGPWCDAQNIFVP